MNCPNCGKEVKENDAFCLSCGCAIESAKPTESDARVKTKTDRLGNWAILMAFFMPVVGLVLGILAVCFAPRREDPMLRVDGIKAIVMSVIVTIVWFLLIRVLLMLGFAAPFIMSGLGVF